MGQRSQREHTQGPDQYGPPWTVMWYFSRNVLAFASHCNGDSARSYCVCMFGVAEVLCAEGVCIFTFSLVCSHITIVKVSDHISVLLCFWCYSQIASVT